MNSKTAMEKGGTATPVSFCGKTRRGIITLISLVFVCAACTDGGGKPGAVDKLSWQRIADLPEPTGLKGMYAGTSSGMIILAGGSHFPIPRNAGGKKVFGSKIFIRLCANPGQDGWRISKTALSEGQGEGASVTTEFGVVAIGGSSLAGPIADVRLIAWDEKLADVRITQLPPLPGPVANATAVWLGGKIYVAGGESRDGATSAFWMLDLKKQLAGGAAGVAPGDAVRNPWKKLAAWPGPARNGPALAVLKKDGRDCIFIFGGKKQSSGHAVETDYLADGYRYDPSSDRWAPVAAMPHRALLPGVIRADETTLLVMGGSDGHDLDKMAELGDRYRLPSRVMRYDAALDEWTLAGDMALGVVAPAVVAIDEGAWLVAGGEYSPSFRTPQVYIARGRKK